MNGTAGAALFANGIREQSRSVYGFEGIAAYQVWPWPGWAANERGRTQHAKVTRIISARAAKPIERKRYAKEISGQ